MTTLRAFSVWPASCPEGAEVVNARTAGAAKFARWLSIREHYPDLPFTEMRCRCLGEPSSAGLGDDGVTASDVGDAAIGGVAHEFLEMVPQVLLLGVVPYDGWPAPSRPLSPNDTGRP